MCRWKGRYTYVVSSDGDERLFGGKLHVLCRGMMGTFR